MSLWNRDFVEAIVLHAAFLSRLDTHTQASEPQREQLNRLVR